jgi:hypothetical protein
VGGLSERRGSAKERESVTRRRRIQEDDVVGPRKRPRLSDRHQLREAWRGGRDELEGATGQEERGCRPGQLAVHVFDHRAAGSIEMWSSLGMRRRST